MGSEKNFEQAISELEAIVNQLEKGDLPLEETLKKFEHGIQLSQFCQKTLDEAQQKIEHLKLNSSKNTSEQDDD
jgi:exodeoxyribonuclease VII small subunit